MFLLLHHELQLKHYVEYSQSVNKRPHYLFGKVPDYHSQGDSLQKKALCCNKGISWKNIV